MTPPNPTVTKWFVGVAIAVSAAILLWMFDFIPDAYSGAKVSEGISQHNSNEAAHYSHFRSVEGAIETNRVGITAIDEKVAAAQRTQAQLVEGQQETNKLLREILMEQKKP